MTDPDATTDFHPQPGAGSQTDRSHFQREIQRHLTRAFPALLALDARRREFVRKVTGARHVVEYFHQVDDAYSYLALEAIGPLLGRYNFDIRFHLTSQTDRNHAPEPELLRDYARRDCFAIAPHYGLDFPPDAKRPTAGAVQQVERVLAGLTEDSRFLEVALQAGRALWQGDREGLDRVVDRIPSGSAEERALAIAAGNELRRKRRHYSGGMFWYAGEWYWGVDRLHHLERRLIALGASRGRGSELRFDRPPLDPGTIKNDGRLSLEIFPSLRSPYTAFILQKSLELADSVDVPVTLRPVMPMVMRGVPAPAAKGIYIMTDALREANQLGVPFGNMYDPIGAAVECGFALWPFARDKGRGAEFLVSFLDEAFVHGRPTGTSEGLRRVVEGAGLSFEEARATLANKDWRDELESNRLSLYQELGVWGVPSFRLRGPTTEPDLSVWGQDRLWLVAAEIRRRLRLS